MNRPAGRRGDATVAAASTRRAALVLTPPATNSDSQLPIIPGWISEETLSRGRETQIVRIHRAGDREQRPFVAKLLRLQEADARYDIAGPHGRFLSEVLALRVLGQEGCPNIPSVVSFGVGFGDSLQLWYVMPHYAGGAMWAPTEGGRYAEPYRGDVDRVLDVAEAVATTLAFMHEGPRLCIHGAVTTDNVLLTAPGGRPALADFGDAVLAGATVGRASREATCPSGWLAPELGVRDRSKLTTATDIFMLGGLMYEALTEGRVLPPASAWTEPYVHERPEYSLRRDTDDPRIGAVSALLCRMLTRAPTDRLWARQVARACHSIRTGRAVGRRVLEAVLAAE